MINLRDTRQFLRAKYFNIVSEEVGDVQCSVGKQTGKVEIVEVERIADRI